MAENTSEFKEVSRYPSWFNKDQVKAMDELINWFHDSAKFKRVLIGAAGTGKSTIIEEFRKQIGKGGFVVSAPTHKALRVIRHSTKCEGLTVQKLLGFRPNYNIDNFNPNNIQFDPFGKRHIENYTIIIIDESSMLTKKMGEYIDAEAKLHGVKILYVGDDSQLPPVNEGFSSIFRVSKDDISRLNQVMRQGTDNDLVNLLAHIRYSIEANNLDYINNLINNRNLNKGKGWMHVNGETFEQYVSKAFSNDEFYKDIDFAKIVTYTNKNVAVWNNYVRNILFPDAAAPLIIHDLITCYNTIVDDFNDAKIINSEDYIIEDINDYVNDKNLSGWMVRFKEVSTGRVTPYMFVLDHSNQTNLMTFITIIQSLVKDATSPTNTPVERSKKWHKYYEFKDNVMILIDIKDPANPKKNLVTKDLDYGYAITVHKSQGSTYKHVFVNLVNIIYGDRPELGRALHSVNMINRLFYVAASRPSDTLTILF